MNLPLSTCTLGLLAMIGAPALLLEGLRHGFAKTPNEQTDVTGALLYAAFALGWLAAMIGLRRLQASGRGSLGRFLATAPLVTLPLALGQSLMDILKVPTSSPFYIVTDLAWPLSMVLTFAVSVAVLLSGGLSGWHRLVPLLCGLSLPATLLLTALTGQELPGWVFGAHTALGWLLLGYVVFAEGRPAWSPRAALGTH
ncbi:hypothetical protein [Meiothermus granaticius]|uniref:Uncharacterized protein n=1 Tax=Meiothermus granaticius NBRC 107808 TaxID=1227551 RepID=A0A399FE30_9DEIN|nr:hypothetical protein [Meiothermus granaticius]MCL6525611.1 hypothetical protein [Thermaceae bacterium]RIH93719.1 hypothetical protein Mgrana_00302 [Meiothermus granaticius NBRC 107808]GEM85758.1 hypothetical protein MGR01S_03830 [Meiothermus granaticius NBRC 107808]